MCIGTCLWVTGTIDTLDANSTTQTKLYGLIIFLVAHSLIFGLLSYFWRPDIEEFIAHMIINEESNEMAPP